MVARLNHPNIVGVNDRGVEDGQLWISMPYIDGMDAEVALAQCHGPMPAARAIHIVSQIAAALDFAHRNGLWHRDVKPANILLAPGHDSEPERVWLSDFGIAKAADEGVGLTTTGKVIATFDYASPEQIAGRAFDHRVDIYALGCVLYKLLTGSVPYPGTTLASALHGHVNLPPPRPTSRTPWLAPGWDQVIARAMATCTFALANLLCRNRGPSSLARRRPAHPPDAVEGFLPRLLLQCSLSGPASPPSSSLRTAAARPLRTVQNRPPPRLGPRRAPMSR